MVPVLTLRPGRRQETAARGAGEGWAGGGRCLGPPRGTRSEGTREGTVSGSGAEEGARMWVLERSENPRGCECEGGIEGRGNFQSRI